MDFTSIPLTSHSAPIDEYIVLWTADKHKKLKKWHDGYMRYHTFNKRLMVYDHLMNKVCDKFLPESEQMDVGDELIFDSHLITIEDVKGRQTQDLRPLFEKTVDRRRERGATSTPVRTVGTPGASTQSPTPTLLRSIPSRPSTGHGRPIYPSPATKSIPQKSPEPPVAAPQKRNSLGAPIVQKINYKPLKVSRVEDNRPVPSYTRTDVRSSSVLKNRNPRAGVEPPEIGLATNLADADDDIEMLELDLERGDFAARPKPSARVRPNAPLPFKPPRPQKNTRTSADITKQSESNNGALPSPHPPEPTGVPVGQATHTLCSSPRIPPSTVTNYSQELLSSPSFRKKPKEPPFQVQEDSTVHASSPVKSPSHIQSPDPTPEEKVNEPGRLTLPSATSRNRRKLLCGPAGRGSSGSKIVSLSRPVSTLSILNTFPKDDGPPAPRGRREHSKGLLNKAGLGGSPKPNSLEGHEKPAIQKTSAVCENTSNHSGPDKPGSNKLDTHWKPLWDYNDLKGPLGSGKRRHLDTTEIQSSERYTKPNEKQGKDSALCIFSSDEEDLEPIVAKQNSKRSRLASPESDSSLDEFEPMRSSAVPKHLVGQSRNAKLQPRQRVPEASRIWREGDSVD